MAVPTRLRIAWQDDNTLRVETDGGLQTRRFQFGPSTPLMASPSTTLRTRPRGPATWQGDSIAQWERLRTARGVVAKGGSLKVVTSHVRPGYLRKNGVPYSADAVLTEWELPVADTTGVVPHYLPGENPFVKELTEKHNIPVEAVLGAAETMYPEYRRRLKGYVPPACASAIAAAAALVCRASRMGAECLGDNREDRSFGLLFVPLPRFLFPLSSSERDLSRRVGTGRRAQGAPTIRP